MNGCPFCRTPIPDNDADMLAMIHARVEKKDPAAIYHLGGKYAQGGLGLQKDVRKAIRLWTEATELGSVDALYNLGEAYYRGDGVQADKAKAAEYFKKAAMQGHAESRYRLGVNEGAKRNIIGALKHFLISAKMGDKKSIENIKNLSMAGIATKEQYTEALRGYQEAVEEMKSCDRDEAKALDPPGPRT